MLVSKKKQNILLGINIIFALFILLPLLYAVSIAFMPSGELFSMEMNLIPKHPTLQNFKDALSKIPLLRFVLNSFLVAGVITLGQIITCSLSAFAISFLEFKGKGVLFMLLMATMMVPGEATIIANYLTVSRWGWIDSYRALIIPYMTSAMGIFLLRQNYLTFPKELQEASLLDGCSNWRFLLSIVVPLSRPALGALGAYVFLNTWNQFMWPLLNTNSDAHRTVQIGISMLYDIDAESLGLMMAGVVIVIVPSLSIFVFMNKQLINGLMAGAVKG